MQATYVPISISFKTNLKLLYRNFSVKFTFFKKIREFVVFLKYFTFYKVSLSNISHQGTRCGTDLNINVLLSFVFRK